MQKDTRPTNNQQQHNSYFTDDDFLDSQNLYDSDTLLEHELDTFDACSSQDCTGLIPNGNVKEKAIDEYKDIYDFGSPK